MRRLLTLAVLSIVAVLLTVGCTPKAEPDAGTEGVPVNKAPAASDGSTVSGTDDDKSEDEDEAGDVDKKDDEEGAKEGDDKDDVKTTSVPPKPEMKLTVYRNAEGKLMCPVMDVPIESEAKAFSHADYKGKRYYFCCDGCPTVFDKNKDTYAK